MYETTYRGGSWGDGSRPGGPIEVQVRTNASSPDARFAVITFNRPEVLNAMSSELCRATIAALHELAAEHAVIVLRGAGGNFSVGGDIAEVQALREQGPEALEAIFSAHADLLRAVTEVDAVVVAAVEGYALAGGFELLQVCDVVLLSESAALGDHHIRGGQLPAGGGSQRLPRLIGRQRALAHLLTGDRLDAATAVDWGIGYRWAPRDEFESLVDEVVARLVSKDQSALRPMKMLVAKGIGLTLEDGLRLERDAVLDTSSWREFNQ